MTVVCLTFDFDAVLPGTHEIRTASKAGGLVGRATVVVTDGDLDDLVLRPAEDLALWLVELERVVLLLRLLRERGLMSLVFVELRFSELGSKRFNRRELSQITNGAPVIEIASRTGGAA